MRKMMIFLNLRPIKTLKKIMSYNNQNRQKIIILMIFWNLINSKIKMKIFKILMFWRQIQTKKKHKIKKLTSWISIYKKIMWKTLKLWI